MYVDRGIDRELAMAIAEQVHADPDLAVEVHAREELGVDPDNLPSPLRRGRLVVRVLRRSARASCRCCPTCSARARCGRRW